MLTLNANRGRQFAAALIARGLPPHADRWRAPAGKMPACLLVELRRREGMDSQRTAEENTFLAVDRVNTANGAANKKRSGILWTRKEIKLLMQPAGAADPAPFAF